MRTALRHRILGTLLLVSAVVTLLPPGAWSLCLNGAGHLAIEPTGSVCSEEQPAASATRDACSATEHGECEDHVLLDGHVTTTRDSKWLVQAAHALALTPTALAIPHPAVRVAVPVAARQRTLSPLCTSTVLRC